jgi:hypothetical protein
VSQIGCRLAACFWKVPSMIVNFQIFEAYLECSTKCWLRSRAEPTTGNAYAEWARAQNEAYYEGDLKSLREILPESDRAIAPPLTKYSKDATWRLAIDVRLRTNDLEPCLQAVGRIPSEGRGRSLQFVARRFEFANKLTKTIGCGSRSTRSCSPKQLDAR